MATSIEQQLYPASTEDSKSIPMEIIRPLSLMRVMISSNAVTGFTLPADYKLLSFYATIDCGVKFAADLTYPVSGINADTLFLPAFTIMTIAPAIGQLECSVAPFLDSDSGYLAIQSIQKWAGLGLRRQATSK